MSGMTVTLEKDGTLRLPKEAVEKLGAGEIEIKLEGRGVQLEPKPRKFREIKDPEERARAVEQFLSRIQRPGNPNLPDWKTLQDEIYD
jgi:hypothetical protein